MRICVVGTGYVGLVLATCLSDSGRTVCGVDIDESKVERLRRGEPIIYEPGLQEILKRNISEGRLEFTTVHSEGVPGAAAIFICVETPSTDSGLPDTRSTLAAVRSIAKLIDEGALVILKSTVPVGTADEVRAILKEETGRDVEVVSNPEFLKEGSAVEDFMRPDRVVVGTDSEACAKFMRDLYSPFVRTGHPILVMSNRSAELTKYGANAILACRISFINELANLSEALGANIWDVRAGMTSDRRIGKSFLFPGVGYGGSCFPKDTIALAAMAREKGIAMRMVEATHEVNEQQKTVLVSKVQKRFGESLDGVTIAIWGLSFKPRTDDMREAASVRIIDGLVAAGAKIRAFDPEARETAAAIFGDRINILENPYEVLEGASALCLVTEWNEFRQPDFGLVKEIMKEPVVFDGRNIWSRDRMEELGFEYFGIGC